MAVSATKDFWIHPNALTITLNYFDDPQLIQTSMLAGSVILAYNKNYIGYDAAHNYREWKLQAFPTQLNDTCAYYVHAELSRDGDTAMIIYSPVKRDIEGRSFVDGAWDSTTSSASWFIYLGEISASVDADGATVERVWTDGLYTGTLATDQQRMEDASGEWKTMFNYNAVTGQIEPLKPFSKIKVMGEAIFQSIAQFVNGLVIGKRTITEVAASSDSGNESKVSDATLPTTGYVQEEIEALDDHFLIKDGDDHQEVGGDVSFGGNVSVAGEHSVGGSQSVGGNQHVIGAQTIDDAQEVKGLQTLHGGFVTNNFSDVGGQITGAQLTQAGVFSVAGLKAMSFEVFELIYNKIRAVDGKLSLSSTGVVEHCEIVLLGSGLTITPEDFYAEDYTVDDIDHLWLTFKEDDFNKGLLQFTHNDILYGYVNQIGESGQYARGGQSCMYVLSTNEEIADANAEKNGQRKMTIKVKLFADDITDENGNLIYDNQNQVVGNMSPTIGMSLAHRGNINGNYPERMTSFFIDSQSGNIIMLQNVMTPQINKGHYGVIVGKLPTDLYNEVREYYSFIKPYDPVVYARYGIFENILQIDHQGQPIQRENNRGEWSAEEATNSPYVNDVSYYDVVTYQGSLYKCVQSNTTQVPGEGADWLLLVAKGTDGKDGLTPNPNMLLNTNFDLTEADGNTLTIWKKYNSATDSFTAPAYASEYVQQDTGLGFNALYRKFTSGSGVILQGAQVVNLKPNVKYTISCYSRYDGDKPNSNNANLNAYGYGITFSGTSAAKFNAIGLSNVYYTNFGSTGGSAEIYFGVDWGNQSDWVRHSVTFEVTEAISALYIRFYAWAYDKETGSTYYYSQLKLEAGENATPYQKSQDDLKGQSVNIVSTSVKYAKHTSGTSKPTSWSDTMPTETDGYYLWTWTRVEYNTGNVTDSYSVSRMGIDGRGIKSAVTKYCQKENTDVSPENFEESVWGEFPSSLKDGWWLYSRTITTYSDDSISKSYNVTQNGQGSYYAGLQEYYAASSSSSAAPTGYPTGDIYASGADMPITGDWSKTRPTLTDEKPYLWNFSVSFDSKGNRYVVVPVCIGNFAKGIKSIVETYAISASSTAPKGSYPEDITAWTDEQQNAAPTEEKPYQWNRTQTTYNDDSVDTIYHVSAVKGKDGVDGKDGLTSKSNLFVNSNFDLLESDGEALRVWKRYNSSTGAFTNPVNKSDFVTDGYEGFNAVYRAYTTGAGVLMQGTQTANLKAGVKYTLSCYSKHEGGKPNSGDANTNAYGYGLTFTGLSASKLKELSKSNVSESNFGSTGGSSEIRFGVGDDTGWIKRSITFEVLEDIPSIVLRLYAWSYNKESGTIYYYSQPKLEVGEAATPYQKGLQDYNVPIKSTVFKRSDSEPSTPTGGTYQNPVPKDWSDGIPAMSDGDTLIWSSTCTFYVDGTSSGWSKPQKMVDSADFETIYSIQEEKPSMPPTFDGKDSWFEQEGVAGVWYDDADGLDPIWMATCNKKVGGNWGKWTITQVKGEDGESPIYADLTNEMDSIGLTADGKADNDYELSTVVSMYLGTKELELEELTTSALTGWIITPDKSTGKIVLKVTKGTENISEHNVVTITLKAVGVTRTLTFTIAGVKSGPDGAPAELYRLIPTANLLVKDKDGNITPSTISCTMTLTVGGENKTPSDKASIKAYKNGTEVRFWEGKELSTTSADSFKFELYVDGVIKDSETIEVVSDGQDGKDGKDGLTAKSNLFVNSNFDLLESDGEALRVWKRYNSSTGAFTNPVNKSDFVTDGYEGYNAVYRAYTTGAGVLMQGTQTVNLKAGVKYTLSCYSKYEGGKPNSGDANTNAYGYGITFTGLSASKLRELSKSNVSNSNFGSTGGSSEIRFGVGDDTGWIKRSITFEVLEDIPSITLRLYAWSYNKESGTTYYYSQLKLEVGEVATPYQKNQEDLRGLTGPAGEAGAMLYPLGVWESGKAYSMQLDANGKVVGKPLVYYQAPSAVKGSYYVLKKDVASGADTGDNPSLTYWEPMTEIEFLYTKAIMANFAMFGGNNGGVFYDKYLFSQKGTNRNGSEVNFSKDIFDTSGNLNGSFIPNLMLNFLEGEAVFQKMTEYFHRYEVGTGLIKMDKYYNIIVTPKVRVFDKPVEQGFCTPLVILPQFNYVNDTMKNGTHVSIFADFGDYYDNIESEEEVFPLSGQNKQMSTFALISADDVIGNGYIKTGGGRTGSWIVANGYRSKFLLLSPGNMLKLRLAINEGTSTSGDESYYWVVEGEGATPCRGQLFATPLLNGSWTPTHRLKFSDYYKGGQTNDVRRIRSSNLTKAGNWYSGDDSKYPYSPVLLAMGDVGIGFNTYADPIYAGQYEPNIILSTASYTQDSNGDWEGGWYSNCCFRLLNEIESKAWTGTSDDPVIKGAAWPSVDDVTMTS